MVGVMVGAAGISQLSDIYGRRWLFLISTWLLFVSSFSQGFAPNYILFALSRFVTGILYSVKKSHGISSDTLSNPLWYLLGYGYGRLGHIMRKRYCIHEKLPFHSGWNFLEHWLHAARINCIFRSRLENVINISQFTNSLINLLLLVSKLWLIFCSEISLIVNFIKGLFLKHSIGILL